LTKADGSAVRVAPIDVEDGMIVFRQPDIKRKKIALTFFSEAEQVKLKAWMEAVSNDHHHDVIKRVQSSDHLKVLFIGNSYNFDIPKAFEKIAKDKGKKITVDQVTRGGWTLKKHANSAKVLEKIQQGTYDIVVLQEQSLIPSFPEAQRASMMDAPAKKLVKLIKQSGATPVFFQTWGRRDGDKQNSAVFPNDTFAAMQKRLTLGYANTAEHVGGAHIIPVGEILGKVMLKQKQAALNFYQNDGSHPSKVGVTFGASIIYSSLYNEPSDEDFSRYARHTVISYPLK